MAVKIKEVTGVIYVIPSRELTYPYTSHLGKIIFKLPFLEDMLVPLRVYFTPINVEWWGPY